MIRKYLTVEKAKLLANSLSTVSLTMPQFKYSVDKILKIHERTLHIVYDVSDESYENLLNRSDDISVHQKHQRYLAIEVYKSLTKLGPVSILLIICDEVT